MDKIVCFGKNYQDHMLELGDKLVSKPVIFIKPASVIKQCNNWGGIVNAMLTQDETHYECEMVIKLNCGGYKMSESEALSAIGDYTIGLDMTLRICQAQLKQDGHPWTIAKVFPDSCIIGPWLKADKLDFLNLPFSFFLDGVKKQSSVATNMIFNPVQLIQQASNHFPLLEGDIIFTGTPSGVGAVQSGSIGELSIGEHGYKVIWQ